MTMYRRRYWWVVRSVLSTGVRQYNWQAPFQCSVMHSQAPHRVVRIASSFIQFTCHITWVAGGLRVPQSQDMRDIHTHGCKGHKLDHSCLGRLQALDTMPAVDKNISKCWFRNIGYRWVKQFTVHIIWRSSWNHWTFWNNSSSRQIIW